MTPRPGRFLVMLELGVLASTLAWGRAAAAAASGSETSDAAPANVFHGREYLVPALAENPLSVGEGRRPFLRRISFSPGYGTLGSERLYSLRGAYNPSSWLGYEVALGHNPGDTVHALLHTLSAHVRYPLPWRLQPYGTLGYGMIMVFPGESLNAAPVTKNALAAGGGIELYIRDDVALRFEMRNVTVLGGDSEEVVAYRYGEGTLGLSFYRGLASE
jgi:hypothetical protein